MDYLLMGMGPPKGVWLTYSETHPYRNVTPLPPENIICAQLACAHEPLPTPG